MKRLIIGGLPCPREAWEKLFPPREGIEQLILPFYEVVAQVSDSCRFYDLVTPVKKAIEQFKPDIIVLHDLGVTLGILSILKIRKIDKSFRPWVVIFNGAFRGFNIFKAMHPFRIQFMPYESFQKEVDINHGEVDARFKEKYSNIKSLYRQIIAASIFSLITSPFKKQRQYQIEIGSSVLILASRNDPYIPFQCLKNIEQDFSNAKLKTIDYGHFPYSGNIELIQKELNNLELTDNNH